MEPTATQPSYSVSGVLHSVLPALLVIVRAAQLAQLATTTIQLQKPVLPLAQLGFGLILQLIIATPVLQTAPPAQAVPHIVLLASLAPISKVAIFAYRVVLKDFMQIHQIINVLLATASALLAQVDQLLSAAAAYDKQGVAHNITTIQQQQPV
jgi:hypothetical protein